MQLCFFSLNYCFAAVVLIATNKVEYKYYVTTDRPTLQNAQGRSSKVKATA